MAGRQHRQPHQERTQRGRGDPHRVKRRGALKRCGHSADDEVERRVVPRSGARDSRDSLLGLPDPLAVVTSGVRQCLADRLRGHDQLSGHEHELAPVLRRGLVTQAPVACCHRRRPVGVVVLVKSLERRYYEYPSGLDAEDPDHGHEHCADVPAPDAAGRHRGSPLAGLLERPKVCRMMRRARGQSRDTEADGSKVAA